MGEVASGDGGDGWGRSGDRGDWRSDSTRNEM